MSRITDYVLEQEANGELEYSESKAIYEQRKSLESTFTLTREQKEYMKTDAFAKEWDNFIRDSFF